MSDHNTRELRLTMSLDDDGRPVVIHPTSGNQVSYAYLLHGDFAVEIEADDSAGLRRKQRPEPTSHRPYKAAVLHGEGPDAVWWPESSKPWDTMVLNADIPGGKKTAELCAKCCNIAYGQALEDVAELFEELGLDAKKLLGKLKR